MAWVEWFTECMLILEVCTPDELEENSNDPCWHLCFHDGFTPPEAVGAFITTCDRAPVLN